MAKQTINIGTGPNTSTGEGLRTAFTKVNENFTEVYTTSENAYNRANVALSTAQSAFNYANTLPAANVYPYIELTERHEPSGNIISFTRPANTNVSDVIDTGLTLARANNGQGIYNSAVEASFNRNVSPANTEWNWTGWDNLDDVEQRHYRTFTEALRKKVGNNIVGAELVMHDITNDKYYKVKFTNWDLGGVGGVNGAFAYTRELIDTTNKVGITFEDGTTQITASNPQDWPVVWLDNDNYTLRLIDANRTLRGYDMTIFVPRDSDVNFSIGTQIRIIVEESIAIQLQKAPHPGEEEALLFLSGSPVAQTSITLLPTSYNILTKIDDNEWIVVTTSTNIVAQAAFDAANAASGGGVTGNIVISSSNSEINFVANSSGDGVGYSTIELKPDTNATQDQYVIIDPTAPSHIHIRAGGTQDASQAELYLGGERKYVKVNDNAGIRIQDQSDVDDIYYYSDPTDYTSGTWYEFEGNYYVQFTTSNPTMQGHAFDFTNNTELNELTVYYEGGAVSNTLTSASSASNLGGGVYRVGVNEAPQANNTSLSSMDFRLFTTNTNYLRMEYNDFEVSVRDDIRMYGRDTFRLMNYSSTDPIEIFTDYDDQEYRWSFNPNGSLTFPDGGTLRITSTIPTTSIGSSDDRQGTLAFNNTYIYFCTANYDGTTNVWKRLAWSGDTW